jgi:hypothetical protein
LRFFTNRESSKCTEIMKRLFSNNSSMNQSNKKCDRTPAKTNPDPEVQAPSVVVPPPPPPPPSPPQLTNPPIQVGEELFWFKKRLL